MSDKTELSKTFDPNAIEDAWYERWEKNGCFKPNPKAKRGPFCIIMPPPNVTGILHAGHALDATTQDTLIRYKRMKGFDTLWLPGMDHAGIATQNVVEKLIWQEEKKTKFDYDREKFIEKIWQWKDKHGGIIADQLRKIGASCDWNYSLFTMDDHANEAVRTAFVKLYNEGLIYQADYIVNWDPVLHSAISDAEVEHVEVKGAFYHLKYSLVDSDETLEIATTRPETLLGDTAVCVHPEDERFKHLIGKKAIVPICNREVPILGDDYVDRELGTGCLKVTPGHDFNDFEIGQRHNLPIINLLTDDGKFNENSGDYNGLTVKEARKKIITELTEQNILVKKIDHHHSVGHGDRSKAVIEPRVSKQWFLNVQELAKEAVSAVEKDQTRFYPKQWENTYFSWLREPKNWCISRQLWWGHQIPVYNCHDCSHQFASVEEATSCEKCQSKNIVQDPDVLDTWFSSGLWPMTTLGWPNKQRMKEKGYGRYYPSSVLITGFDIIFFWVARMMMMGIKETQQVPFHHVYIHAIVRDKFGRKMSKSLGNGIDPLEMVKQYGADAFRFTLAAGSGYNRTLNLDPERINGYRNFMNKVWNAFRFISPFLEKGEPKIDINQLDHHERWIVGELNATAKIMNESLEEYRFDDSCQAIYSFVYDKFCSWFIELSKARLYGDDENKKSNRVNVLKFCFKDILALLHPFCPFLTEEIWQHLKSSEQPMMIQQSYPEHNEDLVFIEDQKNMNQFIETVTVIRNLRSSVGLKPKEMVKSLFFTDSHEVQQYFLTHLKGLEELARTHQIEIHSKKTDRPKKSVMKATSFMEIFIPLDGVIDLAEHIAKLKKDLDKSLKEISRLEKKLSNQGFVSKAPKEVIAESETKLNDFKRKAESTSSMIDMLS